MAQFDQSDVTRQAITQAAQEYLAANILTGKVRDIAARYGVSEREVYRWRAFLLGKGSQQRSPLRSKKVKPQKIHFKGDIIIGGDPRYRVHRNPRGGVDLSSHFSDAILSDAISDPDEAWQAFFDEYGGGLEGWIEDVDVSFS